jgi:hypothetical protein
VRFLLMIFLGGRAGVRTGSGSPQVSSAKALATPAVLSECHAGRRVVSLRVRGSTPTTLRSSRTGMSSNADLVEYVFSNRLFNQPPNGNCLGLPRSCSFSYYREIVLPPIPFRPGFVLNRSNEERYTPGGTDRPRLRDRMRMISPSETTAAPSELRQAAERSPGLPQEGTAVSSLIETIPSLDRTDDAPADPHHLEAA